MENELRLREDRELVEARLRELLPEMDELTKAMRYSLLAGGKRLRAVLVLEFCRSVGGDPMDALDAACAVEMLHTYTLIHDDLPCMDNDDLRRGKPTNHVVFGEWLALLAGDALQTEAFSVILQSRLSAEQRAEAAGILAKAAGASGICKGQYLDLDGEDKMLSVSELNTLNEGKTGALFAAACAIGCICGGHPEKVEAARKFGYSIGAAFQIRDDILDEISSSEALGKPIGSDARNGKNTMTVLLGIPACEDMVHSLSGKAKAILKDAFSEPDFLCWLVETMAERVQ